MTAPTPTVEAESRELLPCPFCGGEAEINQIGNDHTPKRGFEVKCAAWGCATKKRAMVIRQPVEKAREFAVAAWNHRAAPPTAAAPTIAQINAALDAQIDDDDERHGHVWNGAVRDCRAAIFALFNGAGR